MFISLTLARKKMFFRGNFSHRVWFQTVLFTLHMWNIIKSCDMKFNVTLNYILANLGYAYTRENDSRNCEFYASGTLNYDVETLRKWIELDLPELAYSN